MIDNREQLVQMIKQYGYSQVLDAIANIAEKDEQFTSWSNLDELNLLIENLAKEGY